MNINQPVVLYRSEEKTSKGRNFVASLLLAVSLGVVSVQAGFVLNASAEGLPITSPISAPVVCPEGKELKNVDGIDICVSQNQEQNQEQENTNEENNQEENSTPNENTTNPVTSPEVSPSPSATPTPNSNESNGSSSSGNNSGNSNSSSGSSSAPSCNNEAPKAPKLISAVTTGNNEITLNWEKPEGNVTHYSVSYGLLAGKPIYGNPNTGNVTSYTVKGLAGGVTYYFAVKAVNDCTPSANSNEVAVKVGGKFINTPAEGFSTNVLGQSKKNIASPAPSAIPAQNVHINNVSNNNSGNNNMGLFGKVINFFKGLFS